MSLVSTLDRKFYPLVMDRWDDAIFRDTLLEYLKPEMLVLDLGAGAGIIPEMNFKGKVKKMYGLDPDERVMTNPFLDAAVCSTAEAMPYENEMFDVIICQNVMEHIDNPLVMLAQVKRVLKKGGLFFVKTPNRNHYITLAARITPHRFHQWYNKLRGRNEEDTFQTLYNFNSKSQQEKMIREAGLEPVQIDFYESRPEYLRFNALTYIAGIIYERTINFLKLDSAKAVMVSVFKNR